MIPFHDSFGYAENFDSSNVTQSENSKMLSNNSQENPDNNSQAQQSIVDPNEYSAGKYQDNIDISDYSAENYQGESVDDAAKRAETNRKNKKAQAALELGQLIWLALLCSILFYSVTTLSISTQMIEADEDKVESLKESSQLNKDTAQTIFNFLGPLAATVTAFFFSSESQDNGESQD